MGKERENSCCISLPDVSWPTHNKGVGFPNPFRKSQTGSITGSDWGPSPSASGILGSGVLKTHPDAALRVHEGVSPRAGGRGNTCGPIQAGSSLRVYPAVPVREGGTALLGSPPQRGENADVPCQCRCCSRVLDGTGELLFRSFPSEAKSAALLWVQM